MCLLCDALFANIDATDFAERALSMSRGLRAEHKLATEL
jgi:hypothetical protein